MFWLVFSLIAFGAQHPSVGSGPVRTAPPKPSSGEPAAFVREVFDAVGWRKDAPESDKDFREGEELRQSFEKRLGPSRSIDPLMRAALDERWDSMPDTSEADACQAICRLSTGLLDWENPSTATGWQASRPQVNDKEGVENGQWADSRTSVYYRGTRELSLLFALRTRGICPPSKSIVEDAVRKFRGIVEAKTICPKPKPQEVETESWVFESFENLAQRIRDPSLPTLLVRPLAFLNVLALQEVLDEEGITNDLAFWSMMFARTIDADLSARPQEIKGWGSLYQGFFLPWVMAISHGTRSDTRSRVYSDILEPWARNLLAADKRFAVPYGFSESINSNAEGRGSAGRAVGFYGALALRAPGYLGDLADALEFFARPEVFLSYLVELHGNDNHNFPEYLAPYYVYINLAIASSYARWLATQPDFEERATAVIAKLRKFSMLLLTQNREHATPDGWVGLQAYADATLGLALSTQVKSCFGKPISSSGVLPATIY